jgi:hypothetical protein
LKHSDYLGLISKCSFVDVHISFFQVLRNGKGAVSRLKISIVGEPSNTGEYMAAPNTSRNMLLNFSSTVPSLVQGGYTSLLLGLDQEAPAARKVNFEEPAND